MATKDDEEERLRSVALQNAQSILHARRRAEEALRKQSEWLRVTLASIGDAVISTDAEGRVTFMNGIAESLTGWPEAEALGRPLPQVFHIINEQSRQPVENPALRALREGVIVGLANQTALIARGGTERSIEDSAAPIRTEREVIGCVLVFRDITERRRAEEALRRSEERFRQLAESINDVFWITECPERRISYVSPAYEWLWGFDPNELYRDYDAWIRAMHPEDRERAQTIFRDKALAGIFDEEYRMVMVDGSVRWVRDRCFPLRDERGEVYRLIGIAQDITARKQAEEALQEADRRKNEFLAMLAHELRNPLAPIRNALEIVRRTEGNRDAVRSAAEMMERQIGQMVRLVDDLLDVSRISRGKIELRKGRVELASAVNHAVEATRPTCQSKRLELTLRLPPQPIYLNADPTRLAQVVGNLLTNACKFTDKGGRIWLNVERENGQAVIRVRDTGVGIAAAELPRIFEMFTQVDTSLERTQTGLGIGLALVKNLVEMHGGTVEAHSAGIGQGSELVVRLPILVEAPKPSPEPTVSEPTPTTARRILVVDDNRDSAVSLAMLLELTGNETHTAYDGLEAVEAAEKFRPDMILLDIGLPELNGYEAARKIREHQWGKGMVLVALTGWGQDEDRRKSQEAGFDHHMVKPVDYAALTKLLAELGAG